MFRVLGKQVTYDLPIAKHMLWLFITPRVQVANNHILSKILTYISTILNRVPNYWVLWTLGVTCRVAKLQADTLNPKPNLDRVAETQCPKPRAQYSRLNDYYGFRRWRSEVLVVGCCFCLGVGGTEYVAEGLGVA